jgi:hypothetical protein
MSVRWMHSVEDRLQTPVGNLVAERVAHGLEIRHERLTHRHPQHAQLFRERLELRPPVDRRTGLRANLRCRAGTDAYGARICGAGPELTPTAREGCGAGPELTPYGARICGAGPELTPTARESAVPGRN